VGGFKPNHTNEKDGERRKVRIEKDRYKKGSEQIVKNCLIFFRFSPAEMY
jgi:hypothetical protein